MLGHVLYPEIFKLDSITSESDTAQIKGLQEELELIDARIAVEGETDELKAQRSNMMGRLSEIKLGTRFLSKGFVFTPDGITNAIKRTILKETSASDLFEEGLLTEETWELYKRCVRTELDYLNQLSSILGPKEDHAARAKQK